MNVQSLSEYVSKVLDRNKDGRINFKDFLALFPNNSTAIAVIFVDLMVAAAEYRVWDVGYQMTGDPLKAIGFVLVSAIPFYLGQIFWLNPVANTIQKIISAAMVASALYTSWIFGTADLSQSYDVGMIVSMVVNMTAAYIIVVLAYILFDDGIKANRLKKQAEGAAKQEEEYQMIARSVLRSLAETKRLENETIAEFGDPDLVRKQVDRIRGNKEAKPQPPAFQPTRQFAQESKTLELVPTEEKNPSTPRE